jgi:hypothetical protein
MEEGVQLALIVIEEAVKEAPQLATDIQALFAAGAPTAADWAAFRAKVAAESYKQFVPASQLPS